MTEKIQYLNNESLIEVLLDGIIRAAGTYFQWSRGFPITDYGTEHVMNVIVAQELYKAFGDRIGLVLEETYAGIDDKSNAEKKKGRKESSLRSGGRVDIAVFDAENHPFAVIEGKRGNAPSYVRADIERVSAYIRRFGRRRNGSLNCGALISLRYFDPLKEEKMKEDMAARANLLRKEYAGDMSVEAYVRVAEDQTHVFEDGSEQGYAAVVFLITEQY